MSRIKKITICISNYVWLYIGNKCGWYNVDTCVCVSDTVCVAYILYKTVIGQFTKFSLVY